MLQPNILLIFYQYSSSFVAYPWMLASQGGVTVDVIAPRSHLIKYSKWVRQVILVGETESFVAQLTDAIRSNDYHAVLAIDEPARQLMHEAGHSDELQKYLHKIEGGRAYQVALDKSVFYKWCQQFGFLTPESVVCSSAEEIQVAVKQFGLPCILKASCGAGGNQVYRIESLDEIDNALAEYSEPQTWIVQELCDGEVGTTIFVAKAGRLYAQCSYINRICTADGFGPAAVCEFVESQELSAIATRMGALVDGFTGYDWIRCDDGRIVIIDPHFGRVAPTGAVAHLFGIDLGAAYASSLSGTESPANLKQSCSRVWVFPQCLQLILSGNVRELWGAYGLNQRGSRMFLYAKGEWRMFLYQLADYLIGRSRVCLGAWRRKVFR